MTTGAVALPLALAAPGGSASASTLNGTATVALPGTTTALTSGGSATPFTVSLPPQTACDGDSATHGYHVYSYLVHQGTALSGVTFDTFPSAGYGLVESTGAFYFAVNTAIGTGQIVSIPNDFEWAPLVTQHGVTVSQLLYSGAGTSASGVWESGLVCASPSGAVADNWNTEVTFTASSSDPHGFTWRAVPGIPAPAVTGVSPNTGPSSGGTSTTITGTDLNGATAVHFGATPASSFTVDSPTSITATAPAGAGTVDVTVTTPGGTSASSSADRFTYLVGFQILTSSLPDAIPGVAYGPVQLQSVGTGPGATLKWKKGAPLPKGLKLNGSGVLQGIPSLKKLVAGTNATVTVQVTETVTTVSGKTKVKTKTTVSKNLTLHIA